MTPQQLAENCTAARRSFYAWSSICRRALHRVNWRSPSMLVNYFLINAMHQRDIEGRNGLPLGDPQWPHSLLEAPRARPQPVAGASR
jgi:hypothetical protein